MNLDSRGIPGATIVTTTIDHVSVLAAAEALRSHGYRVEVLAVDSSGAPPPVTHQKPKRKKSLLKKIKDFLTK